MVCRFHVPSSLNLCRDSADCRPRLSFRTAEKLSQVVRRLELAGSDGVVVELLAESGSAGKFLAGCTSRALIAFAEEFFAAHLPGLAGLHVPIFACLLEFTAANLFEFGKLRVRPHRIGLDVFLLEHDGRLERLRLDGECIFEFQGDFHWLPPQSFPSARNIARSASL